MRSFMLLSQSGRLFRMDDGFNDSGNPISWALNTRAYSNQNLEIKNFRRGYVKLKSIEFLIMTGSTDLKYRAYGS